MSARSRTSRALAALSSPALAERHHNSDRESVVDDLRRPESAEFLQRPVMTMSGVENCETEAESQQMQEAEGTRVRATQEANSRMEAELEQMQRKYAEQQRELVRLRTEREPAKSSAGEVKKVPEWARAIARATDLDLAAVEAYFYKAVAEREASLKYPSDQWSDEELRAIFKAKLGGKARAQFEALPRVKKEGSFKALVEAMRAKCKGEQRTKRIVALGKLNELGKTDEQSVADFCIELERLAQKAYPELDEMSLATTRANLLYEQLVAWPESYHLLETLETGGDRMYDALKETAPRVERRRITLENANWLGSKGVEKGHTRRRNSREAHDDNVACETVPEKQNANGVSVQETKDVSSPGDARPIRCFKCNGKGHFARECKKEKVRNREVGSLSAKLADKVCGSTRFQGGRSRERPQEKRRFSKKWTTSVEIFGRKWCALLDTGSEVSILPARILKQAIRDGINIDEVVEELPFDTAARVVDASGNAMKFLTVVRIDIREDGAQQSPVQVSMHVAQGETSALVLGTNILPVLGYRLAKKHRRRTSRPKYERNRNTDLEPESSVKTAKWCGAVVAKRTYVAPKVTETSKVTHAKNDRKQPAAAAVYGCEESVLPEEEDRRVMRESMTQTPSEWLNLLERRDKLKCVGYTTTDIPIAPKIKRKWRVRKGVKGVFNFRSKADGAFFRDENKCMAVNSGLHSTHVSHPSDGPCSAVDGGPGNALEGCRRSSSNFARNVIPLLLHPTLRCGGVLEAVRGLSDPAASDFYGYLKQVFSASKANHMEGGEPKDRPGKPAKNPPDLHGEPADRDGGISNRRLRRTQLNGRRSQFKPAGILERLQMIQSRGPTLPRGRAS
ncbi:hypothetical protein Aduo_010617 [Ancylostoma duodenale]